MNSEIKGAWKHRELRVLVLGEGVSMFGSLVSRLALPWTAARELNQGTLSIGLVFLAELLPSAFLGLFAGTFVDRWSRRRVLVIANLALAAATAVIPLLAAFDRLTMTAIYAVGLISGCIAPFFRAAFRSTVPITVPREFFAGAQSIIQGISAVAELAAFGMAGWLVHVFGGPAGLAIDAGSFVWAAAVTVLLRPTPPALQRQNRTDVLTELRDGARYVRRHVVLGPVAMSEVIAGVGTGIVGSVVIVHVTKTLGYDTGPQGIVYAIGGVGSLVAAALAPRVLARMGLHRSIVVALVATAPAMSLMAFAPGPSLLGYTMLVAQQLLADPVGTISLVAYGTVVAAGSPGAMRGRVESTVSVLGTLGLAAGFVIGGVLGEPSLLGTRLTLFSGAVITAAAALCLTGRDVRKVHTAADVPVASEATGVMS
ncbi:MAG: MFS transporter [Ilumatobacteraceae bacterium]|nr:MFS transporter [Ilumatobacteraceae bacterium]